MRNQAWRVIALVGSLAAVGLSLDDAGSNIVEVTALPDPGFVIATQKSVVRTRVSTSVSVKQPDSFEPTKVYFWAVISLQRSSFFVHVT